MVDGDVPIRDRAILDTEFVSGLMGTTRSALVKRIQRGSFPEPLLVEGRTRKWSYSQILPLLAFEVRASLPPHLTYSFAAAPAGGVQYLGAAATNADVIYHFLIGGAIGVEYVHPRSSASVLAREGALRMLPPWPDGAEPMIVHRYEPHVEEIRRSLPLGEHRVGSYVDISGSVRIRSDERMMLGFDSVIQRLIHPTAAQRGAILDLERVLGTRLPVWPLGADDVDLMLRWRPGDAPREIRLQSWGQRMLKAHYARRGFDADSDAMDADLNLLVDGLGSGALLSYERSDATHRAVVDPDIEARALRAKHAMEALPTFSPGVDTYDDTTIGALLSDIVEDDAVADLMSYDTLREPRLVPAEDEAVTAARSAPWVASTRAGWVLASLLGAPRSLMEWARSGDELLMRTPGGIWWSAGALDWPTTEPMMMDEGE